MTNKLVAIVAILMSAAVVAVAQPKFEVIGGETYDWGKIKPPASGQLEGTIKMKNAGTSGRIKLIEIKPGCGCTKTDPDKTDLGAGEVSSMNVKLNISPAQNGSVSKSIMVKYTNGQDTATTYLFLKADIQRALSMSPMTYLSFSDLKVGVESSASLTIANNADTLITLSDFVADNGLVLNVSGKKVLKPGEKFDLVAKTIPGKSGSFSGKVSLKTDHPEHLDVDIQAYGHVMESTSPVFQKEAK